MKKKKKIINGKSHLFSLQAKKSNVSNWNKMFNAKHFCTKKYKNVDFIALSGFIENVWQQTFCGLKNQKCRFHRTIGFSKREADFFDLTGLSVFLVS